MKQLLLHRWLYIIIALVIIGFVVSMLLRSGNDSDDRITTTVEHGTVQQLVSVSGIAAVEQTALLAFPTVGIVTDVLVEEGQRVVAGEVLVKLDTRVLQADRQDAAASLARAVAARDELITGPTDTARAATNETVEKAKEALSTTIENQERLLKNAQRTLRSSDLEARTTDSDEEALPPTITGTYTCESEGSYTLQVYNSGTRSGYSYNLSGLEFATDGAFTEQAAPLGDCGLFIQFDANSNYQNSVWTITVPNTAGAGYTTNKNALELAQTQTTSAIALAEQDLAVAIANETNNNAPARTEAVTRANADITAAQARIARIDAEIQNRVLTAPFAGTVTQFDILPGETVGTTPVLTLIADDEYEITARIPEIDIGKVLVGQPADIVFDARSTEVLEASIEYIALQATEIDGVAYYEARLRLNNEPDWLRSGLNADIDIIINEATDALRVPKRFVLIDGREAVVRTLSGEDVATSTVGLELIGNDGYVAISGVNEGETLVAPN